MSLSIIIPVRNEEEIILKTLEKFDKSWLTQIDHEIIVINDNSSDETTNLIKNSKAYKKQRYDRGSPKPLIASFT